MAGKNAKIDTAKFIDAWEKEECLWNIILNAYKGRNLRQVAIQKLASAFDVDGNEIKSKINSLRTYYSQELKKEGNRKKSGAGKDEVFESKWPYFGRLSFLRDTISTRKTVSNLNTDDEQDVESRYCNCMSDDMLESSEALVEKEPSSAQQRSTKKTLNTRTKVPKNKADDVLESALKVMENAKKRKFDDAFDIFGCHVGNEIRSLNTNYAQQWAKLKVQEVLFQAQFVTNMPQRNQYVQNCCSGPRNVANTFHSPDNSPLSSPNFTSRSYEFHS